MAVDVSKLKDGARVRIISVPDDPGYASTLNQCGTVEGEPYREGSAENWWVYVKLDGEQVATEYLVSEVALIEAE